jgi:SAM-dependent methyltransferase
MIIKDCIKKLYWRVINKFSWNEPRGQELINRYRWNYGLPMDLDLTEGMILKHWDLEKQLTKQLLESTDDNRWEVFDRCYTTLYSKLEWLNKYIDRDNEIFPEILYKDWAYLIGAPPKKVYEVGSGRGEMISYLTGLGHHCKATEITRERGEKHVSSELDNLEWGVSDGVHFERFESLNTFDFVISNQVIEHMHPDDLAEHCQHVRSILKPTGKYIVCTPHVWHGPADISAVFKYDKAVGMHLKEYTNFEIYNCLKRAGFKKISSVYRAPKILIQYFGLKDIPRVSSVCMVYLFLIEKIFSLIPRIFVDQKIKSIAEHLLLSNNIFIVAKNA